MDTVENGARVKVNGEPGTVEAVGKDTADVILDNGEPRFGILHENLTEATTSSKPKRKAPAKKNTGKKATTKK